jgi:hypothetical protein
MDQDLLTRLWEKSERSERGPLDVGFNAVNGPVATTLYRSETVQTMIVRLPNACGKPPFRPGRATFARHRVTEGDRWEICEVGRSMGPTVRDKDDAQERARYLVVPRPHVTIAP